MAEQLKIKQKIESYCNYIEKYLSALVTDFKNNLVDPSNLDNLLKLLQVYLFILLIYIEFQGI
jgi:hypothetical protein